MLTGLNLRRCKVDVAYKPEDILGFEPMNMVYSLSPDKQNDIIFVKENVHLKDGTKQVNKRIVKNYKRKFWVAKEGQRTYKDKQQWESIENLMEFSCAQHELSRRINQALGRSWFTGGLRDTLASPYVYGATISSTCLLRKEYRTKFPEAVSPKADVAVLDIETDVLHGTNKTILIALTFKDKVFCGIKRSFLNTTAISDDIEVKRIREKLDYYLEEYFVKRNVNLNLYFGDTSGEIIDACLQQAHKWSPDFVAIWNMDFDIPRMEADLISDGYDPAISFSDPAVPSEYRKFKYNPGPQVKTTHSGKQTPVATENKWPTVDTTSCFFIIDAMCLYAKLRAAGGKEESYALDAVLKRIIKMGKLKGETGDFLEGLEWHIDMQRNHKLLYIAYNIFDCIGIELLDEKTGDISSAFIPQSEDSDWVDFNSNPRQIADGMHFHCLNSGYVVGSAAGDLRDELDELVVKPKGWIVTLDAFLAQDIGLPIIKELPNKQTMATIHNADLDIEGTYPSVQAEMNACKQTTIREIVAIEGLDELEKRTIGVNLSAGIVNSCSISQTAFKVPNKKTLLEAFLSR